MKMNWKKFLTEGNIKGLIFDYDGIIADTEGLQYEKWNILLRPYGIKISPAEYAKNYCGKLSATEIPMLLKKEYGDKIPLTEDELGKQAGFILENLFRTMTIRLMPDAKKAILFFISFKLGVCSSKDPKELAMKLASVDLSKMFPPNYRSTQSETTEGLGKPHPAMYRLIVKRMGLEPGECIAFEDTSDGVKSAAGAGLYVIAMPNSYSKGQDFSKADAIIDGGWPTFLEEIHSSFFSDKGN